MARCQCGGDGCKCVILAGDGITVVGSGSTTNPVIISADPDCAELRKCISAGPGIQYDPATGVVEADLSGDAGNNITVGGDGGLYVPTGAATVSVGCGLTGDGSASAPVTARTATWPYACPVDDEAGRVYCDSTGALRSEPRGRTFTASRGETDDFPNLPVPTAADTVILTRRLVLTNPDPCRPAFVLLETELDVTMTLPGGSRATMGMGADDMATAVNAATATANGWSLQVTKVYSLTVAAGATVTTTMDVTLGRAIGGPTYSRIQTIMRGFGFVL